MRVMSAGVVPLPLIVSPKVPQIPSCPAGATVSVAASSSGGKLVATAIDTNSFVGLIFISQNFGANWTQANAPAVTNAYGVSYNSFWAVASSADGNKLVVGTDNRDGGAIYGSLDSGTNWAIAGLPYNAWEAVICSADGKKITTVSYYGTVSYSSTNHGLTWMQDDVPPARWTCAAMSADGSIKALGSSGFPVPDAVYSTTNSGANWQGSGLNWSCALACSADGGKIISATGAGEIYRSTNSGISWMLDTNAPRCYLLASSANGANLIGAGYGKVYTSTNFGSTWRLNNVSAGWLSVATSADGSKLFTVGDGQLFLSTNAGQFWVVATNLPGAFWNSIASSAEGKTLAVSAGGLICISTNTGETWFQVPNLPNENWSSVATSADGRSFVACVGDGPVYTVQLTASSQIAMSKTNGSIGLSWLIPSTDFVLQQSSDLTVNNWSNVTNLPVLNLTNLQNQITLPLPAGNNFYRLKTP